MLDSTVHTMLETLDCLKSEIIGTSDIQERAQLGNCYSRIFEMLPVNFKSSSAYFGPVWKDKSLPAMTLEQKFTEHQITYKLLTAERFADRIAKISDPLTSQDYVSTLKKLMETIPDAQYSGRYFDGQPIQKKINILKELVNSMIVLN